MSAPHKFRKKPVVIEAMHFSDFGWGPDIVERIRREGARARLGDGGLYIWTLEGEHFASVGDWIIRGIQGEFYPCKPDIFDATYEAVE